ncbi:DUF2931 family protein [Salmonella enterica]
MKRIPLVTLVLLVVLTGCKAGEPRTAEETGAMPYGKWGFAFFTPNALPAVVTRALIIDSEKVVSTYRTLDSTNANPNVIGSWNNRSASGGVHFNKARHPPVAMLFCWDSIIDKKTYETHIFFRPSLRETMLRPTGQNRQGESTWYDTMLFGLAPEGKVKIWLQDSAGSENVPLEPAQINTLSGDKLDACKGITQSNFSYGYDQDIKDFIKGKTYPYGNW